jgi:riboflavin kinase/FMN adenylyltransferase
MNIGFNPTVEGQSLSLEIHFLDFEENLYEKNIDYPIEVSSPRTKFESLDELKTQLNVIKLLQ